MRAPSFARRRCGRWLLGLALVALVPAGPVAAEDGASPGWKERLRERTGGRLLATGGVTQVEGAAGGGLVPWAVLSGYGSERQVGGALSVTHVGVDDFRLETMAGSLSFHDRVELSVARQRLDARPFDEILRLVTVGGKARLFGDVVYGRLPQVSFGVQYKRLSDFALPEAVGARSRDGIDFYLAGTKVFLAGPFERTVLVNATVRATRANQLGLLGFGGSRRDGYRASFEGSAVVFLNRHLALGYDYRQQPKNLEGIDSDALQDAFVAWFPNKHLALVGAYTRLGSVATFEGQDGWYGSIQIGF